MPQEFWWGVMMATSGVLLAVQVAAMVRRRWHRSRRRRQGRRARKAEIRAERVLRKAGFVPISDQVEGSWRVIVDGEEHSFDLVGDWLVERDGARFLVEVKTGRHAPSIRNRATRRQLLEYRCAFDVEGVILLDMEARQLRVVEFPDL